MNTLAAMAKVYNLHAVGETHAQDDMRIHCIRASTQQDTATLERESQHIERSISMISTARALEAIATLLARPNAAIVNEMLCIRICHNYAPFADIAQITQAVLDAGLTVARDNYALCALCNGSIETFYKCVCALSVAERRYCCESLSIVVCVQNTWHDGRCGAERANEGKRLCNQCVSNWMDAEAEKTAAMDPETNGQ